MSHSKLENITWTWDSRPEFKRTHVFRQTASKTAEKPLEAIWIDEINELAYTNTYVLW